MSDVQRRNRAAGVDTGTVISALDTKREQRIAEIGHCEQFCDSELLSGKINVLRSHSLYSLYLPLWHSISFYLLYAVKCVQHMQ